MDRLKSLELKLEALCNNVFWVAVLIRTVKVSKIIQNQAVHG